MGSWIMYRPRTAAAARRLTPILEVAARNIAERQVEDITGVTLHKKPVMQNAKGKMQKRHA